ncbi:MAG: hypothetical protein RMK80_00565 [Pseudobdellovibrionaceae bacterium]|nr:hypothetical protein [Pseudobdellovibrionaceae bacterium]
MKRTTAKGLWHIKGRNYLRLDITGPFDLLLAQVFVTPERTVVINHSQKQVKEVLSTELIDIHNVTVRPLDLVALMQKEVPRKALNHSGWSCSQNQSSWTCVQKDAKAAWINPDQFFLEIPGKSLTVTVLNRVTLDTNSHFFEPKYPSHYLKQP